MKGQLSIFDFMGEFANLPEEKMVEQVGMLLGIKFTPEVLPKGVWRYTPAYEYKRKGLTLTVHYMTSIKNKLFISVGWNKGTAGGGAPCDSMDEAVSYFRKILERTER